MEDIFSWFVDIGYGINMYSEFSNMKLYLCTCMGHIGLYSYGMDEDFVVEWYAWGNLSCYKCGDSDIYYIQGI